MFGEPIGTEEQREEFKRWFFGVVLAALLAAYGAKVFLVGHATITTRRGILFREQIKLDGFDARLFGVCLIVGAAALNCHLFWRSDNRYWQAGEIGFAVTGTIWAVLALWLVGRQFANLL